MIFVDRLDFLRQVISKKETKQQHIIIDDNLSQKSGDKHFECPICLTIVQQAYKCKNCEVIYCKTCIFKYKKKYSCCPTCKVDPFQTTKLNKYEQQKLNQIQLNCSRCTLSFKYEEKEQHITSCTQNFCPAECGQNNLNTESELDRHLQKCPNVLNMCSCCDYVQPKYVITSDAYLCKKKEKLVQNNFQTFQLNLEIMLQPLKTYRAVVKKVNESLKKLEKIAAKVQKKFLTMTENLKMDKNYLFREAQLRNMTRLTFNAMIKLNKHIDVHCPFAMVNSSMFYFRPAQKSINDCLFSMELLNVPWAGSDIWCGEKNEHEQPHGRILVVQMSTSVVMANAIDGVMEGKALQINYDSFCREVTYKNGYVTSCGEYVSYMIKRETPDTPNMQ